MEKLKQKVASSSSRVIASLQQAATGTFQQPSGAQPASTGGEKQLPQQVAGRTGEDAGSSVAAAPSTARLMAADATAHLTDEERGILLEVFKKEEQFQRDTIK